MRMCCTNKPHMLKELIKFKANVNYRDYYENNMLNSLLKYKYSGCFDILIKNKINVNNRNILGKTFYIMLLKKIILIW